MRFAIQILLAVSLVSPVAAAAADWQLTPLLGYRSSDLEYSTGIVCFRAPCPQSAAAEDDWLYGGSLRLALDDRWQFELLLNRQVTDLVSNDRLVGLAILVPEGTPLEEGGSLPSAELRMVHLQAGLVRGWQLRSVSPYAAAAAGVTRLSADPSLAFGGTPDGDKLSFSLAAGLDVPLKGRFGARVESRVYAVDLPQRLGGRFLQSELVTGVSIKL